MCRCDFDFVIFHLARSGNTCITIYIVNIYVLYYDHFCLPNENTIVSQTQKDFEIKAYNLQVVTMWVVSSLTMTFLSPFHLLCFFRSNVWLGFEIKANNLQVVTTRSQCGWM